MGVIKTSFTKVKKDFFKLLGLQIVFIITSVAFLVYLKEKTRAFLISFRGLGPTVTQLQGALQEEITPENAAFIQGLHASTGEILFFLFVLVPIIMVVLWTIFQGAIWRSLSEKKSSWKQYIHLFIGSLILMWVYLGIMYKSVGNETTVNISNSMLGVLMLTFVTYYMLTLWYIIPSGSLKNRLSKIWDIGVKKFFSLIIPVIILFASSLILFFFSMMLFLSYFTKQYFFIPPISLSLTILVLCVIHVVVKGICYEWFKKINAGVRI